MIQAEIAKCTNLNCMFLVSAGEPIITIVLHRWRQEISVANNFVNYHLQETGHLKGQSIRRVQLNIVSDPSLV